MRRLRSFAIGAWACRLPCLIGPHLANLADQNNAFDDSESQLLVVARRRMLVGEGGAELVQN